VSASGPSPRAAHRTGVLLLLAAAVLWSLNGLLIKTLQADGVGGCTIAAGRSVFAALVLAPWALRGWKPIAEKRWVVAAVLAFTGMTITFVLATTLTTAANAIILQYTAPAWVFLFAPIILGESTQTRQWLALAGAMIGVAIIFLWQFTSDAPGLGIALTSGLVFGTQPVLFRRVRSLRPVVLAFLACAGSGLVLFIPAWLADGPPPSGPLRAVLCRSSPGPHPGGHPDRHARAGPQPAVGLVGPRRNPLARNHHRRGGNPGQRCLPGTCRPDRQHVDRRRAKARVTTVRRPVAKTAASRTRAAFA